MDEKKTQQHHRMLMINHRSINRHLKFDQLKYLINSLELFVESGNLKMFLKTRFVSYKLLPIERLLAFSTTG